MIVQQDFWSRYLRAHRQPRTRLLHHLGTTLTTGCLVRAALGRDRRWLVAAPAVAFAFGYTAHLGLTEDKPATSRHPFMSILCDYRMFGLWMAGRLTRHLDRALGDEPISAAPVPSARVMKLTRRSLNSSE